MLKRKRDHIIDIKQDIGFTNDLDECTRLYVKNIFDSYKKHPSVKIKKDIWTPSSDFTLIDPNSNELKKITNKNEIKNIINIANKNYGLGSSLFESVFKQTRELGENEPDISAKFVLNTDVIRPGAIVRIWNSLDRTDGNESHSIVTIDYTSPTTKITRRVSFDTNNPDNIKVKLGDTPLPGVAHCIASPEAGFIKKLARVYYDNKEYFKTGENKGSLKYIVKLKAIGKLTTENIKLLQHYLIENTINMKHNYISEVYTKHQKTFYPIQPKYRISTNLFYNKYKQQIYYLKKGQNKVTIQENNYETSVIGSQIMPINCSSFVQMLFPNIVYRQSSLTLNMMGSYIPTAPSMLNSMFDYTCLDTIDNKISKSESIKRRKLPSPSVEYNLIKSLGIIKATKKRYGTLGAYLAQLSVALTSFILWIFPYAIITGILAGSYFIIPLEYKGYFDNIQVNDIINNLKELFSGILCSLKNITFRFSPTCNINTLSIDQLKNKYGTEQINMLRQKMNLKYNKNRVNLMFRKRRSTKKSRRRRSTKKSRRRRSTKKSRRRRSTKKSRRRRSTKKSRRR
jgi:hypothetical protein